ncbi:alpha/beta fold hydrolase [Rhizobium sp. Rhizsp82]|uniref:alpha/beta fold hydrolase n=1 Tax=Rhizobium sp. Rhizsp82 TaxID=3243057 RepID=UPI0039B42AC9
MTKDLTARIPFERRGTGSLTILFIHGFLDSAEVWNPVLKLLAKTEHSTVTFDLPGMGKLTGLAGDISLESYRDDVSSIIERLPGNLVIVAQSMGAQVADLLAEAHPEKVLAMILVAPVPLSGVNAPEDAVADFRALGGNLEAQRNVRAYLSPNLASEELDTLNKSGEEVRPSTVATLVDLWNAGVAGADAPSSFEGPVVLMRGESDPFVNAEMADRVAARFKNRKQVSVKGAGHWLHFEDPEALMGVIQDLLKALTSSEAAGDWKSAFAQKSSSAFADTFSQDVTLEAATLYKPVVGKENVKNVMEAASRIYESLEFTEQSDGQARQYLEWRALAFGGVKISGVTVITRSSDGKIANIAIHHRPLAAAIKFSHELGVRLKGVLPDEHFAASPVILD